MGIPSMNSMDNMNGRNHNTNMNMDMLNAVFSPVPLRRVSASSGCGQQQQQQEKVLRKFLGSSSGSTHTSLTSMSSMGSIPDMNNMDNMNIDNINMLNSVFSPVPLGSTSSGGQEELMKKPLMISSTDLQQLQCSFQEAQQQQPAHQQ